MARGAEELQGPALPAEGAGERGGGVAEGDGGRF